MEVSGHFHATAALPPGKKHPYPFWVGSRAGPTEQPRWSRDSRVCYAISTGVFYCWHIVIVNVIAPLPVGEQRSKLGSEIRSLRIKYCT